MEILPGDVASLRVGPFGTPEQVAAARVALGLDRPLHVRYLDWATRALQGDLGESWRFGIPIGPLVGQRLVNSLYLAGVAFVTIVPLSVLAGIAAATHKGRWIDA